MALPIQSSCFISTKSNYHLLQFHPKSKLSIRSEIPSTTDATNTSPTDEPRKPTSSGLGFGASSSSSSTSNKPNSSSEKSEKSKEKRKTGGSGSRRERAAIRRRTPIEQPGLGLEQSLPPKEEEQGRNESAFLLAWLGLGVVIFVEGIALSASGFLPEEWDKLFVKYIYPSFTPTVFLFVAMSVVYGVLKYVQNENLKGG